MAEKVYRSELTPISFLRRSAYMFPEKTAVVYGERRYTYGELEERVDRLASRLRDSDLQKGDRVAFLCPNIPPMLEGHYGVPAAGLVLVAINTRLSKDEVTYIVEHSGAKMAFVDAELEDLLADVDVETVRVDDTGEAGDPYEDFLAEGSTEHVPDVLEDEEETISINYTSGTTGRPKGVMYTYRGAYLSALGNVIETGDGLRDQVPVDPPHVPLQRLDLPVGRDVGGGHARLFEEGRGAEDLGALRERGDHPLLRRADRPDRGGQRRRSPPAGDGRLPPQSQGRPPRPRCSAASWS